MALLTQIRNNLSKVFGVFAVVFCIYIMLDWGLGLGTDTFGIGDAIGEINGEKIKIQTFNDLLQRELKNYKDQGGQEADEEVERQIRSQVWNTLVNQKIIDDQIKKLGIVVSDEEVRTTILSPDRPEFVTRLFVDSLGSFNEQLFQQVMANPQYRQDWIQIEDIVREQRKGQKISSVLTAGVLITESEIRGLFEQRSTTFSAEYVGFDPDRFFADADVQVTDKDLKKFYDENRNQFRVDESRDLKYVRFDLSPSKEDSSAVAGELNHFRSEALRGSDFTLLANTYSEAPVAETWFSHGQISREKEGIIFSARTGDIVGPVFDAEGGHIIKILDERRSANGEEYLRASHILIRPDQDTMAALVKINDLLRQIKSGASFEEIARLHSHDGSAQAGGDLGYTRKGMWVKPFEDAAWRAPVGKIVGPVRTQFGWHLIKVKDRSNKEKKVITMTMRLKASPETVDEKYDEAQQFVLRANNLDFDRAAKELGYEIRETGLFQRGGFISGLGQNDMIESFAFANSKGEISQPFAIANGVVVVQVAKVREKGFLPLDEVKDRIRPLAMRQKKFEQIASEVSKFQERIKGGASLQQAAQADNRIEYQVTGPFLPINGAPGVGRDLAFIGTLMSLQEGQLSGPFKANRGMMMVKLISRSQFDETLYAAERPGIREQLLQERRQRRLSEWLQDLRENSNITDNRHRFFR